MIILLIALGGAVGSVSRYLLGGMVQRALHLEFPMGTFVVNVVGCLLIGVFAKFFVGAQTELPMRATLMIGFCGGFTTFSAFSNETFAIIQGGDWPKALLYATLSMVVCIGATALGYTVSRPLNP